MSDGTSLHGLAKQSLELADRIKELTETRMTINKELAKSLPPGMTIDHNGQLYEWIEYDRSSTGYKALYTEAYGMLPDTEQVIMGERELKATKTSTHHKFDKVKVKA